MLARRRLGRPDTAKDRPVGCGVAYFAVSIGMTAQTAETDVTATKLRMHALLHGDTAFVFNAIIVAAAVNVAVAMGG